jgi:hypothetical protein
LSKRKNYPCPKCGIGILVKNDKTPGGKQRWKCNNANKKGGAYCYKTTNPEAAGVRDQKGDIIRKRTKKLVFKRTIGRSVNTFIVTAAQNATPAHEKGLKSFFQACNDKNAELFIIPFRYKNPTSHFPASQAGEQVWDSKLQPYLWNARKHLNQNLVLVGDIKIQPTAATPLTGFEGLTRGESGIFGHTKMQLKTVATPQGKMPKILTTTGAVTVPNYIDCRAGKTAEFHHSISAVLIETDGRKVFHMRQLRAHSDTGMFSDLTDRYGADWTDGKVERNRRVAAMALGDWHTDANDPKVRAATIEMFKVLKPRAVYLHDLLNGGTINHHERNNPFWWHAHFKAGKLSVEGEVRRACEEVEKLAKYLPDDCEIRVVNSNHDRFLDEWIENTDWRKSPGNMEFYNETVAAKLAGNRLVNGYAETPSAFAYWLRKILGNRVKYRALERGESSMVEGIEHGMHGDDGPNGARGTTRNLSKIGVKSTSAHIHGPAIEGGADSVGTSSFFKQGYNHGPSNWLQTHGITYEGGKRTLVNIIDQAWRLE